MSRSDLLQYGEANRDRLLALYQEKPESLQCDDTSCQLILGPTASHMRCANCASFWLRAHTKVGLHAPDAPRELFDKQYRARGGRKKCRKCQLTKDTANFGKNASYSDGYMHACKACKSLESKVNYRKRNRLPAEYKWDGRALPDGSTFVDRRGYVQEKRIGHQRANRAGWVPQHILVAESAFGVKLTKRFTVHHKNGDKKDNRPSNLDIRVGNHGKHADLVDNVLANEELRSRAVEVLRNYGYKVIEPKVVFGSDVVRKAPNSKNQQALALLDARDWQRDLS